MNSTSPKYVFNGIDLIKTLRTGLVICAATFVLFLMQTVEPTVVGNLPVQYAFLIPVISMISEGVRRWATDHSTF